MLASYLISDLDYTKKIINVHTCVKSFFFPAQFLLPHVRHSTFSKQAVVYLASSKSTLIVNLALTDVTLVLSDGGDKLQRIPLA